MTADYTEFLASKLHASPPTGIEHPEFDDRMLFPFQRDMVAWSLIRGCAAVFADAGLGKTRIEALWSNAVYEHTGGNVLIFAPLAVAYQSIDESSRIGVSMRYVRTQEDVKPGISITNYDRLESFDLSRFSGVCLDESSILKSFDGKTKLALCGQARSVPFRLAATATPAPNDHDELLNHSEFLGVMPRNEALSQFFYHDGGDTSKWSLKRHARDAFWRWVCSWAALVKLPSDLGYSDDGYILPPLNRIAHVIPAAQDHARSQGLLFAEAARTLNEQRRVRRGTLSERAAIALDLVASKPADPWVIWCELNDESRELARVIPGAVEVHGSQKLEDKERLLREFSDGKIRVLVTKPKIAGMGMNWQHCADTVFVGASHSHEQTYQALRRFWRFGQKRNVNAHFIYSELEGRIMENLARKEAEAEEMAQEMRGWTREIVRANLQHRRVQARDLYDPTVPMTIPDWLRAENR